MITRAFAERYRDSYEAGLTVEEYVDFYKDCQRSAPEDEEFARLTEDELEELAEMVIEINEA
jgi:hypothetical protein